MDCSATCKCDYGVESGYKNRTCTNPEPAYGGKECLGESFATDVRQCTLKECPGNCFILKYDKNNVMKRLKYFYLRSKKTE